MVAQESIDASVESLKTPKRPWWTRASAAQIFMIVAGILAFIVNLTILRARDDVTLVAVAATDINAGVALDEVTHISYVEINGNDDSLAPMITSTEVGTYLGRILSSPMQSGDLFIESELVKAATPLDQRAIALAVGRDHAVGGEIGIGDRVDVIWVNDDVAQYVVTGVEVIDTSASERTGGAFSSNQTFSITVAVDDVEALRLAEALNSGQVEIIRSTGADTPRSDTLNSDDSPEPDDE